MATKTTKTITAKATFPLAGEAAAGMRVMECCTKITLRGNPDDNKFITAAKTALGFPLPTPTGKTTTATTTLTGGGNNNGNGNGETTTITALCLSPDEWQLWSPDNTREPLLATLKESMHGITAAIVDISDYYAQLQLEKPKAKDGKKSTEKSADGKDAQPPEDLIASGSPINLSTLKTNECTQTHHGATQLLIHHTEKTYTLQTRISMLPYLWARLKTAL